MERLLLMNYRVKPTSLAKEKQSGDLFISILCRGYSERTSEERLWENTLR